MKLVRTAALAAFTAAFTAAVIPAAQAQKPANLCDAVAMYTTVTSSSVHSNWKPAATPKQYQNAGFPEVIGRCMARIEAQGKGGQHTYRCIYTVDHAKRYAGQTGTPTFAGMLTVTHEEAEAAAAKFQNDMIAKLAACPALQGWKSAPVQGVTEYTVQRIEEAGLSYAGTRFTSPSGKQDVTIRTTSSECKDCGTHSVVLIFGWPNT